MKRSLSFFLGLTAVLLMQAALFFYLPPAQFAGAPRTAALLSWHSYSALLHNAFYQLPGLHAVDLSRLDNAEPAFWSLLLFATSFAAAILLMPSLDISLGFSAASIALAPQALFGPDILILRLLAFALLAFLTLLLCSLRVLAEAAALTIFAAVAFLSLCYLGIFAELPFFVALLLLRLSNQREILSPSGRMLCFSTIVAVIALSLFTPGLPFPNYPEQTRLISFTAVSWFTRPLIGPDTPLPLIERTAVQWFEVYTGKGLILLSLAFFFMAENTRGRRCFLYSGCIALLILIDALLPEPFALLAPLASIARSIPGLCLYPAAALAVTLAIVLLAFGSLLTESGLLLFPSLISSLVLIACFRHAPLAVRAKYAAWASPASHSYSAAAHKILESPSFSLIRAFGPEVVLNPGAVDALRFRLLNKSHVLISASGNNEREILDAMLDRDPATRWWPGNGLQKGNEWLHLSFPRNQLLRGISLLTGNFTTDFPRALRISSSTNCMSLQPFNPSERAQYATVATYFPWQGSVLYSDEGLPYFSGQDFVRIVFPEALDTRCLLIEQTGMDEHYDWSVAELRVALEPGF